MVFGWFKSEQREWRRKIRLIANTLKQGRGASETLSERRSKRESMIFIGRSTRCLSNASQRD